MAISPHTVTNLAKLAKLNISEDHEDLTEQLNNILNFVEQINGADTHDLAPMSHPLDVSQPLREDIVTEDNQREVLMENAPEAHDGFFLVPKVID